MQVAHRALQFFRVLAILGAVDWLSSLKSFSNIIGLDNFNLNLFLILLSLLLFFFVFLDNFIESI